MKSAGKPGNVSPKPEKDRLDEEIMWYDSQSMEVKGGGTEGSRPGYAMASKQVTTGVRDQGMYSQGWRGNSGEPFVSLYNSR